MKTNEPALDIIVSAYGATKLVPCMCGPEVHRLSDGRIAAGPFFALYIDNIAEFVSELSDGELHALADQAEQWSRAIYGAETVAAFTAGFDRQGIEQFDGVAACSLPELLIYHAGERASLLLGAVYLPYEVTRNDRLGSDCVGRRDGLAAGAPEAGGSPSQITEHSPC